MACPPFFGPLFKLGESKEYLQQQPISMQKTGYGWDTHLRSATMRKLRLETT